MKTANALPFDLPALTARWGRRPGVSFAPMYGGMVALLESSASRAIVALQGAQVLSWNKRDDPADVLWLSPMANLATRNAVRGGIPVCWPWFGPHSSDTTKPAHGIARTQSWRVTGSAASARYARLVLAIETVGAPTDAWPYRAKAEIEITVGEKLTVALTTDNLGPVPFTMTEALHTYLQVGNIADVNVEGLAGKTYIDQLQGGARKTAAAAPITITAEADLAFIDTPETVTVRDAALAREITVAKTGSLSTVVWNPWIEKGARLGDLGDEGYQHMLCVEAANVFDNAVVLEPRGRHRLMTEISVRSR